MDFTITLVQMPCKEGDRHHNFNKARMLLHNHSSSSNLEFVMLPELFAIGFRHDDYDRLGPCIPGPTQEFLEQIAEEYDVYALATGVERTNDKYYNTLVMASPKGKIVAEYRKIHPFLEEKDVFKGGDRIVAFETKGLRVGLQTCYDVRFPEVSRRLAIAGAQLLLIPAAFPDPRQAHWNALLLGRAIENQLFVAAANRVGVSFDKKTYFGHSQVIDPWGIRYTRINSEERVISQECNSDAVKAVREQITCYQDRVPDAYDKINWFKV